MPNVRLFRQVTDKTVIMQKAEAYTSQRPKIEIVYF